MATYNTGFHILRRNCGAPKLLPTLARRFATESETYNYIAMAAYICGLPETDEFFANSNTRDWLEAKLCHGCENVKKYKERFRTAYDYGLHLNRMIGETTYSLELVRRDHNALLAKHTRALTVPPTIAEEEAEAAETARERQTPDRCLSGELPRPTAEEMAKLETELKKSAETLELSRTVCAAAKDEFDESVQELIVNAHMLFL